MEVLGQLLLSCDNEQCSEVVALKDLQLHLASGCTQNTQLQSNITVSQLLSRPLSSPPTTVEKEAASRIVKRLMHSSPSGQATKNVITLPTAGQVGIHTCTVNVFIIECIIHVDVL